jgi:chitinase
VSKGGTGTGTVTSSPGGIDCGSDCSERYPSGTVVTLSATPASDATFAGWSGGGCSGTGACPVTLSSAKNVTATFTLKTYTLKVSKSGTGKGTVTSSPTGITCGSTCAKAFPQGTAVSLTATPYTGSAFAGWGGACSGSGACQVTLTSAQSVTASFVPLTLRINDASLTEGHSGTQDLVFTLSLSGVSAGTVKVDYATANGSATAGSDYTLTKGTLSFAPGVTQQTLSVPVLGDTTLEPNETLSVNLSRPSGASLADKQGLGLIRNDDGPALSIADASRTEGDSGSQDLTFTVTLSAASAAVVTVNYATQDLTAIAGSDYVATSGTLTFPANSTSQTVTVALRGDTDAEANEGFSVLLFRPSNNAYLADSQGLGLIVNDDSPTLSIADAAGSEGDSGSQPLTFTVTLSAPSANTVTVNYATQDLTATAGSDYVTTSGTLSFAPGVTTQTFEVTLRGDTALEPDETLAVRLSRPNYATLADDLGVGTIVNDD